MPFDPYQACPCGSGKKVKFCCCKDIVQELGRAVRALEGDQRAAAVEQLERLLARHGDRPALLTLKAEAQMASGDWRSAEQTVEALSSAAPHNPVALAQAALAQAQRADCDAAVRNLQRAIEGLRDAIPVVVYETIGVVARLLLARGDVPAARKHLLLEASVATDEEEDQEAIELLMNVSASPETPLLFKEDFGLADRPNDVAWGGQFDEALELAGRAAWLAACERLEPLASQAPHEPAILMNLAILYEWLGDSSSAAASWRRYSATDGIALDDAVEAEARAQLLQREPEGEVFDFLRITYPIPDVDELMARLLSDRRASQTPIDRDEQADQDEPPPKAAFLLLDRPMPNSSAGLTCATTPVVVAQLSVFGRQTDREARLELYLAKTKDFSSKTEAFAELTGELVGPAEKEEVIGEISAPQAALSWTWRLPNDTPREQFEALLAQQQRAVVFDVWPTLSFNALDGKCANEVAGDPDYRVRLLSLLLGLEFMAEQRRWDVDFEQLRGQLGLPGRAPIDPADVDLSKLPLARLSRLLVSKLSNQDLKSSYRRAAMSGAFKAMRLIAQEVVERDGVEGQIPKSAAYNMLVSVAYNSTESLAFNDKGREAAVAEGLSAAHWLIQELAIRLGRGETQQCQQLVRRVQTEHGNEPEAKRALYELMVRCGAISLDEIMASPRGAPQPGVAAGQETQPPSGRLWTPDSPTPAGGGGKDKPSLWTPGQS